MGKVFRAFDQSLGTMVAIKVLSGSSGKRDLLRLQQEAKTLAKLNHPNIVKVLDFNITEDNLPYLIMDFVDGPDLAEEIVERNSCLEPSDLNWILEVLIGIAGGMNYAHGAGVLHRDLKPSNILLQKENGAPLQVKVLDFGLAKHLGSQVDTTSGAPVKGTPAYMSPEQGKSDEIDAPSDIYSFGCIAYELMTGDKPFAASGALDMLYKHAYEPFPEMKFRITAFDLDQEDCSRLLEKMEAFVARCMAKDPADRYESFAAVQSKLSEFQEILVEMEKGRRKVEPEELPQSSTWILMKSRESESNRSALFMGLGILVPFIALSSLAYLVLSPPGQGDSTGDGKARDLYSKKEMSEKVEKILIDQNETGRSSLDTLPEEELPEAFLKLSDDELLKEAQSLYKQEKYLTALTCANKLLSTDPDRVPALILRSDCYEKYEKFDLALKDLDLVVKKRPEYRSALERRARVLKESDNYPLAIKAYDRLIELYPERDKYWARKARLEAVGRDLDKAISDMSRAIELRPTQYAYKRERASFYISLGKNEAAIPDLSAVIKAESRNGNVHFNRGVVFYNLGRYKEAIEDFSNAIERNQSRSDFYIKRAMAYDKIGRHDLAGKDRDRSRIDNFELK